MTSWINIKWNKFRTVEGTWWCTIYSCFRYHILYNRQCSSAVNIKSISLLDCLLLLSQGWLSYEIIHSVICSVCERDNQWRRQTQEVGGAEVRGSGGRSPPAGSRGGAPSGGPGDRALGGSSGGGKALWNWMPFLFSRVQRKLQICPIIGIVTVRGVKPVGSGRHWLIGQNLPTEARWTSVRKQCYKSWRRDLWF